MCRGGRYLPGIQGGQKMKGRPLACCDRATGTQEGNEQPGRPPARGTRALGRASFDARIRGSTRQRCVKISKQAWREHLWHGPRGQESCGPCVNCRRVLFLRPSGNGFVHGSRRRHRPCHVYWLLDVLCLCLSRSLKFWGRRSRSISLDIQHTII
jgi:hypothetical protein